MRHKHHDLIVKWAANPRQTVWFRFDPLSNWKSVSNPSWVEGFEYHIGPTPPAEKITLAGITFTAPSKEALGLGQQYYFPCISSKRGLGSIQWRDSEFNFEHLQKGMVFLTAEDAALATKAMLKALNEVWE